MSDDNDSGDSSGPSWSTFGNSTCLDPHSPEAIWSYCPSLGAAVFFAVVFFLAMGAHIGLAIKFRRSFCWVLIMGCAWELFGFGIRAAATQYQQSMALFVPSMLFILLAPLWINAFVYMVFARLVYCYDPNQKAAGIPATKLGVMFVCLDIVAFLVQLAGGSMLSDTDPNTIKLGKSVYMAGIGFQEAFLVVFLVFVIVFQRRNRVEAAVQSKLFHPTVTIIYVSLALITARIIFRLVEYSQGFDSPIVRTEWYQYVFDALPMWVAVCLWTYWHPGRVLQGPNASFPSRKEKKLAKKEAKAAKKEAKEAKKARKAAKKGGAVMLESMNNSEESMLGDQRPQDASRQQQEFGTVHVGYAESFSTSDALESQAGALSRWERPAMETVDEHHMQAADIGYVAPHPGQARVYQHY